MTTRNERKKRPQRLSASKLRYLLSKYKVSVYEAEPGGEIIIYTGFTFQDLERDLERKNERESKRESEREKP